MATRDQNLRVLIVEDEALVAMLIEDVIAELGHESVGVAARLEAGLAMAKETDADFAVVDLKLNGERTYAIAEVLLRRGIRFMFVTGYGAAAVDAGWRGQVVVQKPFEVDEFERAMARALM